MACLVVCVISVRCLSLLFLDYECLFFWVIPCFFLVPLFSSRRNVARSFQSGPYLCLFFLVVEKEKATLSICLPLLASAFVVTNDI